MAQTTYNELNNSITFKIEDHAGFQCFRQGINDRKQWMRHPETQELSNVVGNNQKQSQIIVQYNDDYLPLKMVNR